MFGLNPQAWLAEHRRSTAGLIAAATTTVVTAVSKPTAACTELACC